MLSAVTYAMTNILLRQLATDNDPLWITCMKAVPTFGVACALIAYRAWFHSLTWPSRRALLAIVVSALFVQLGGNVMWQWSLGVLGLALTVPVSFGTLITGSAVLGRACLGEPITGRSLVSMLLLIASIVVLAFDAEETSRYLPVASSSSSRGAVVALGVAAASTAGVAYALVAVVVRTSIRQISIAMTLLLISGTGVVALGMASIARLGLSELWQTRPLDFLYMLLAGTFNAIGFFALGKSLRLVSVVHANVLNASQAAIAVVTGILLFHEPSSWALVAGVLLTILGLAIVRSEPHSSDSSGP